MHLRAAVLCAWLVAGAAALAAAPGPSTARKLKRRVVALNRKARFQYEFLEKFEAGIALEGTEVKISEPAAGLLNDTFGTDAVEAGLLVGIAEITVDLPA